MAGQRPLVYKILETSAGVVDKLQGLWDRPTLA